MVGYTLHISIMVKLSNKTKNEVHNCIVDEFVSWAAGVVGVVGVVGVDVEIEEDVEVDVYIVFLVSITVAPGLSSINWLVDIVSLKNLIKSFLVILIWISKNGFEVFRKKKWQIKHFDKRFNSSRKY